MTDLKTTVLAQEAMSGNFGPRSLIDFSDPQTIEDCKPMADDGIGGSSTVTLDHIPAVGSSPAHVRFHGTISTELPANDPQVFRTGFAGWRNKDLKGTIFGKTIWDLSPYTDLAFRVKTDGRKYIVNIQTESIIPTDIHQHRLHTQKLGEWETVFIPLHAFVRTNQGEVVEPQNEIMTHKITSVGLSITDQIVGPYDLAISKVWAQLETATEDADDKEETWSMKKS